MESLALVGVRLHVKAHKNQRIAGLRIDLPQEVFMVTAVTATAGCDELAESDVTLVRDAIPADER